MRTIDADELKKQFSNDEPYGPEEIRNIIDKVPTVEARLQAEKMGNTNIHFKNRAYVLLDEMRTSIISMDLFYSRTTELLNQILAIEKTIDSIDLSAEERGKEE